MKPTSGQVMRALIAEADARGGVHSLAVIWNDDQAVGFIDGEEFNPWEE